MKANTTDKFRELVSIPANRTKIYMQAFGKIREPIEVIDKQGKKFTLRVIGHRQKRPSLISYLYSWIKRKFYDNK